MYTILMTVLFALAPSNMELAEDALLMAAQGLPADLSSYGVNKVLIEIDGEHEGNWLVKQTVSAVLHENGIAVYGREELPDSLLMTLRVRPMELVVEYGDVSRPWIIGNKRVERLAKCELSSTLFDTDGTILMTERTSGVNEDVISWSDAEVLAGSPDWDWLTGDLPENTGGGILEPVIVSGVVASLVYLFYSSRAQ